MKELKKLIEESGLRNSFIAELLGLSERCFYNRINGHSSFKLNEMYKLKSILGIKDEQFFDVFFNKK